MYGGSGYLGAEAVRRLLAHPEVELAHVYAGDHLGEPLAAALPNLEGATQLRFEAVPEHGRPPDVDIMLLALPHTVSHEIVREARHQQVRIIDMSGAFRVDDPAEYQRFYGDAHPLPELLPEFIYGLPELNRDRIRGARFVASPGCFATAIELSLLPLANNGWLRGAVASVGVTGSTGAGHNPTRTTHHATRMGNLRPYKPLEHTHAPEIRQALTGAGAHDLEVNFVPVAAPLGRGILATSFATLTADLDAKRIAAAYRASYEREPFVVYVEGRLPEVVSVVRSNRIEVGFKAAKSDAHPETLRISCFSAIDNLVKGGAGQAIQNLNLMLGLEETLGLRDLASYP